MESWNAYEIQCEWDEDGCALIVDGEGGTSERLRVRVSDPEQLYDRVKAAVLPWLMERDEALRTMPARLEPDGDWLDAYDPSDPKHPRFHSVHADLWDMREGK